MFTPRVEQIWENELIDRESFQNSKITSGGIHQLRFHIRFQTDDHKLVLVRENISEIKRTEIETLERCELTVHIDGDIDDQESNFEQ
jgi:hypothetical protein